MRRPLCAFCLSALGVLVLCSFLPQMGLLLPSAAIFVVFCLLVWWKGGAARGYAVCLFLGAVLGVGIMKTTGARLAKIQDAYAGRDVALTAEVESTGRAYTAGRVSAVLMVEKVDGEAVRFRVECASLPKCEAGGRIRGRFSLDVPDATQRLDDYADGIVLSAEYLSGMLRLGQSESFRARTARLQAALSRALRKGMAENTGGVLAAMVVGDRSHLTSTLRSAYRGAGLSHVLVVSGLHVTIFCGLLDALPHKERERSRAYRRVRSLLRAGTALLLVGITGATPSVLRAAVAVWVSSLGVWVGGPADTLTSLGAAGVLMCLGNGYAVYDVGFELSFAAVMGTLAGAECAGRGRERYYDRKKKRKGRREKPSRAVLLFRHFAGGVWDSLCVSLCASAATFPVLVLRGLSVSAWAVVSSIAVLWMVQPLLLLGLAVAFVGLVPWLAPVHGVLSRAADLLTGLLNGWAVWLSTKPGAAIYFDTVYAALVCLLLCGLGVLAFRWRVRLRVALPGILLAAAVGIGLGNALSRDVVHIDLVGSAQAPAVVIAQNDRAVVLFRGGSAAQRAVENQLARRGVRTVELVVDLRMNAKTACTLPAQQGIRAERLPVNASRKLHCTPAAVELLRTREGCLVRLSIGNRQFVTLSGKAELAQPLQTEWLIATPKKPETVQYQKLLALRSYSWMPPETQYTASLSLRRTGGERLE